MPYAYNPVTGRDEFVDPIEAMFKPTTSTTTVEDLYKDLGRPADTGGKAFWESAFGPTVDEAEKASFMKSVKDVLGESSKQEQQVLAPSMFGSNIPTNFDEGFVSPLTTRKVAGKDYTIATKDLGNIEKSILGQNLTSQWSGEGFGSAQANAQDMANILASIGITDIRDFGKITKKVPTYDESGNEIGSQDVVTYGNKKTGQEVPNTYSERQTGNAFGGTFAGKGNTGYRVQFAPDGTPVFYTTGASSNDLVNLLGDDKLLNAIAQIGAGYFGGPAGTAALNLAMGKDLGDVAKSVVMSYLGNQVAQGVSGFEGVTDVFGDVGSKIIGNTAGQYVSSGGNIDPLQALISGGVNAGTNAILGQIPEFGTLDPTIQKLATKAVSNTLMGGQGLSAQDLVNAAFNAGKDAIQSSALSIGPGNPQEFSDNLISGYFAPGGEGYVPTELKQTYGPTEAFDPSETDWAALYADTSGGSPAGLNVSDFAPQNFGVNPLDNFDSYQNTLNQISNDGGFSSQWQTVGTNRVFVNDDGTATVLDPTTQETSFLTEEQVNALVKAGVLNSEASGYVKATGGTDGKPGGSGAKNLAKVTPKKTTTPTTSGGSTTVQAPSQDPYAHIKLMEELFGTNIDYKLRALEAPKNVASSDLDALARMLRG